MLADLQGPGVVNHLWMTIADNEYGWPRLLRLRVYYDGSETPERGRARGRLLRGRQRRRRRGRIAHGPQQLRRPRPQLLLADAVPQILQDHRHQRRPPPREHALLPRRLGQGPFAAGEHALLPRPLPAVAARARRRLQLRIPERQGPRAITSAPSCRSFRPRPAGSAKATITSGWMARRPSIEGTGSEDYFNDAWGLHVNDGPYYGVTVAEGTGSRLAHDGLSLASARTRSRSRSRSRPRSSTRAGPTTPMARSSPPSASAPI